MQAGIYYSLIAQKIIIQPVHSGFLTLMNTLYFFSSSNMGSTSSEYSLISQNLWETSML